MKCVKGLGFLWVAVFAAFFALSACDDSSSASSDETGVSSSSVESPDSSVTLSGASAESNGSSNETKDKSSSSENMSSSSAKETKNSSDSKSSSSVKSGDSSSSSSAGKVESSSSKGEVPKSYAEAKVMPSGTYDCSKYNCFTTEYLNQEFLETGKYGEILDERDSQVYKTVQIGEQIWMAQNLNYAYTGVPFDYEGYTSDSTSWCYDNDPANCDKYGRLYTWAAAMDSVGEWSTNGKGCGFCKICSVASAGSATLVRGICPSGWHLPKKAEFETLFTAVGGSSTAGTMLKSTSGWDDYKGESGNGTDAYGFSALPAGYRWDVGNYSLLGSLAYFWSATEERGFYAYVMGLYYKHEYGNLGDDDKKYVYSIRCVKDSE